MPQLHILSERVLDDGMAVYSVEKGIYICGRGGPFSVYVDDAFYYADINVKDLVDFSDRHVRNGSVVTAEIDGHKRVIVKCGLETLAAPLSVQGSNAGGMAMHDMISDETSTTGTLLRYGLIVRVRIDWS